MAGSETTSNESGAKPFQFRLRTLLLVTSAIAVALGLLKELGPGQYGLFAVMAVQYAVATAILVRRARTDRPAMVMVGLVGLAVTLLVLLSVKRHWDAFLGTLFCWALAACIFGAMLVDAEARQRSVLVQWGLFVAGLWMLVIVLIGIASLER